jgi:hypothetical protein
MMQWLLHFWASCPAPTMAAGGSQQESEHDYWRTKEIKTMNTGSA